jgi:methylase of polypeptide subunit release factors
MESFTWKGRMGPFPLAVGKSTFRPSTITTMLAESMKVDWGQKVIDVGCGSGILSIIAAKLGASRVIGVDPAAGTVEVASANARSQGVEDRTTFYEGDMFDPVPEDFEADLVIGDVSGIPDTLATASGWFPGGHSGGPTGAELPMRMLDDARRFLRQGGRLLLPTGSLQDETSILERVRERFGNLTQLSERTIPLPSALSESPVMLRLLKEKVVALSQKGSRFLWTARVWEAQA